MSLVGTFSGFPQATTTPLASLLTAIQNARPGTVITVDPGGSPLALTLASLGKAQQGVAVLLRPEHKIALTVTGPCGVYFDGGQFVGDEILGELQTSRGAKLTNASRVWFNGCRFGKSDISLEIANSTDVAATNCIFEFGRGDAVQASESARLRLENIATGEQTYFPQFTAFNDGRLPVEGQSLGTAQGAGGVFWSDSAHADLMQLRDNITDALIAGWDVSAGWYGQAIGSWGVGAGGWDRILVRNNTFLSDHSGSLLAQALSAEVRDNIFGPHPIVGAISRQNIRFIPQGGSPKFRTGGNTLIASVHGSMQQVDIPTDATGALSGPVVDAPLPVGMHLPTWYRRSPRPTLTPLTIPTPMLAGPSIVGPHGGGVIGPTIGTFINTVGTWLSCQPRGWTSRIIATKEFRWTRNGTPISGATSQIYQIAGADSGTVIGCQMRMTNGVGDSGWVTASNPRAIA